LAKLASGFAVRFSFMTIDIPAWQCLACEQYTQIGLVSVIATVNVGLTVSLGETGLKPEKNPWVVGSMSEIGVQGLAKVDWVTVWFFGLNWNWTKSPIAAVTWSGRYSVVPLEFPTVTTWTV